MSKIDYVYPEYKLFPIAVPSDILKAVEVFHLFRDELCYEDFSRRLVKLAENRGKEFVTVLPLKIKKVTGLKIENRPESNTQYKPRSKKRTRFIKYDEE